VSIFFLLLKLLLFHVKMHCRKFANSYAILEPVIQLSNFSIILTFYKVIFGEVFDNKCSWLQNLFRCTLKDNGILLYGLEE